MRIWDIDPGYLNRQSLLGEHRELHGIVRILTDNKKGYARHPETLRWTGRGWALRQRHRLLASEMKLRGYHDRSPVLTRSAPGRWPQRYIDTPAAQFRLLADKYVGRQGGRIALPTTAGQLWSQHKYSLLARNPSLYSTLGRKVAANGCEFDALATLLVEQLRQAPTMGGIRNALQHMWGYVADNHNGRRADTAAWSAARLLGEIQRRVVAGGSTYLLSSTALAELMAWL
jgi:hypothetical protein